MILSIKILINVKFNRTKSVNVFHTKCNIEFYEKFKVNRLLRTQVFV